MRGTLTEKNIELHFVSKKPVVVCYGMAILHNCITAIPYVVCI